MRPSVLVRLSHFSGTTPIILAVCAACGQPPLRPRPPSEGAPHFTVMSYNVELGAEDSPKSLENLEADIVCLQEVTPAAEVRLRATYAERYPYQLYKSKGGAGGL